MTREDIIKRLGHRDAYRLFRAYGGTRVSVPGRVALATRLAERLDDTLATRLVLHFGKSRFYVPLPEPAPKISVRKLNRLISQGQSSARIALALHCSERTVDKYRAKVRKKQAVAKSDSEKAT